MHHIFPYQTQSHYLLWIPLSFSYRMWNFLQNLYIGWYKCRMSSHAADGLATVIYPNHCTETIDLRWQKWKLASANAPCYLPPEKPPPLAALPRIREKNKEIQGTIWEVPLCKSLCWWSISHIIQQIRSSIHPQLYPTMMPNPWPCTEATLSFCFSGKANIWSRRQVDYQWHTVESLPDPLV